MTEAEVGWVLGASLDIVGDIVWEQKNNRVWVESTLRVRSARENGSLQIRLTYNRQQPGEPSISLLYRGARIRALDVRGSHKNDHTDGNRWIKQTHEHRWTDLCHGGWAGASERELSISLEGIFRDFCMRNGMTFSGNWHDPPGQA